MFSSLAFVEYWYYAWDVMIYDLDIDAIGKTM